jgi:hypothetical protein
MSSCVPQSIACKGTTGGGYDKLQSRLRSVVFNPQSLALFAATNSSLLSIVERDAIKKCTATDIAVLTADYDSVLSEVMQCRKEIDEDKEGDEQRASPKKRKTEAAQQPACTLPSETTLTKALADELDKEHDISVLAEWPVKMEDSSLSTGKIDLVFYKKEGIKERHGTYPVRLYDAYGFMEVGISTCNTEEKMITLFWEKLDQLLQYMDRIGTVGAIGAQRKGSKLGNKPGLPFPTHAVIQSVVILSKSREKSVTGVFFGEWCDVSKKWRVSLLYVDQANGSEPVSQAFSKVLATIKALKDSRKHTPPNWTYLGPDCVKVEGPSPGISEVSGG